MKKIHILLIDDEPSDLRKIVDILTNSEFDFEIYTAINVKMAMKIADVKELDIIISDWIMPGINGIEGIKLFKTHPKLKDIPIIIVTGLMLSAKNLKIALNAGAEDFVSKPINNIELIARINAVLRTVRYFKEKTIAEKRVVELKYKNIQEQNKRLSALLLLFERKNKALQSVKNKVTNFLKNMDNISREITEVEHIVDREITPDNDWEIFELHLQSIDNDLYQHLTSQFPQLNTNDLRLCMYLKFNITTRQIADIMNIEIKSVQMAKTRLRKKLNIPQNTELTSFLQNY